MRRQCQYASVMCVCVCLSVCLSVCLCFSLSLSLYVCERRRASLCTGGRFGGEGQHALMGLEMSIPLLLQCPMFRIRPCATAVVTTSSTFYSSSSGLSCTRFITVKTLTCVARAQVCVICLFNRACVRACAHACVRACVQAHKLSCVRAC